FPSGELPLRFPQRAPDLGNRVEVSPFYPGEIAAAHFVKGLAHVLDAVAEPLPLLPLVEAEKLVYLPAYAYEALGRPYRAILGPRELLRLIARPSGGESAERGLGLQHLVNGRLP